MATTGASLLHIAQLRRSPSTSRRRRCASGLPDVWLMHVRHTCTRAAFRVQFLFPYFHVPVSE
eukprot:2438098-Rhodomonas_salina.1